jgi:hypothetical protein
MKEYIAYREVDPEGDVWSENAFLFETREDVSKFFTQDNPDLCNLYCEDGLYDPITEFEITNSVPLGHITQINFKTAFSGKVNIVVMNEGYLIQKDYKPLPQ